LIVTTSRYAGKTARDLAKKIAENKKSEYMARGKKTVNMLAETAWKKGHDRILVVEEKDEKPGFISEMLIDHWGKWKWGRKREIEKQDNG